MKEHRNLWHRAFHDTEQYIDYFFDRKAPRSWCVENWEAGQLCTMAFFIPYEAVLYGKVVNLPYIVGVATEEKFRRQGRMKQMLCEGMNLQKKEGRPLVFLSPADPAIYEPLGFQPVYRRETFCLTGSGKASCDVYKWNELNQTQKEEISALAEEILSREQFDLRIVHSVSYYEEVHAELQSLNGALLTFWQEGEPVAVANWICEDEKHEVTEWIGEQKEREKVLQSLLWYVQGEVDIEDTYFLQGIKLTATDLANIQRREQKHPYLMVRMLDESVPMPERCYINDIT